MEKNVLNEGESVIWRGNPSQLLNLGTYLLCGLIAVGIVAGAVFSQILPLMALALLPLAWAGWKYLTLRCRVFELTSERLRLYEGVLNQTIGEVELYRVKDTNIVRPFWLRLFGLATITADTSDRTHPNVELPAIGNGVVVREQFRKQVEAIRDRKRVREIDFDGSGDGDAIEFEN